MKDTLRCPKCGNMPQRVVDGVGITLQCCGIYNTSVDYIDAVDKWNKEIEATDPRCAVTENTTVGVNSQTSTTTGDHQTAFGGDRIESCTICGEQPDINFSSNSGEYDIKCCRFSIENPSKVDLIEEWNEAMNNSYVKTKSEKVRERDHLENILRNKVAKENIMVGLDIAPHMSGNNALLVGLGLGPKAYEYSIKKDNKDNYYKGKYDQGKLRYDLVLSYMTESIAEVLTFGQEKGYGPHSWKTVPDAESRYDAAAFRHFQEYRKAKESGDSAYDEESGLQSLKHCLTNIAFLIWCEQEREKKVKKIDELLTEEELRGTRL